MFIEFHRDFHHFISLIKLLFPLDFDLILIEQLERSKGKKINVSIYNTHRAVKSFL